MQWLSALCDIFRTAVLGREHFPTNSGMKLETTATGTQGPFRKTTYNLIRVRPYGMHSSGAAQSERKLS